MTAVAGLTRTQRRLLAVFAGLNVIDVAVSVWLFYGARTHTEINPVFAWAVGMPVVFTLLLVVAKAGAIGIIAAMTAAAERRAEGAGTMVATTADCMTAGLLGVMAAGMC